MIYHFYYAVALYTIYSKYRYHNIHNIYIHIILNLYDYYIFYSYARKYFIVCQHLLKINRYDFLCVKQNRNRVVKIRTIISSIPRPGSAKYDYIRFYIVRNRYSFLSQLDYNIILSD